MKHQTLSRDFLLKRGFCCHNGCKNCPYKKDLTKEKIIDTLKKDTIKHQKKDL